jgi:D-tyrosyl-tRNA(Tyr) deacylase
VRAVIQRVSRAEVKVAGEPVGRIGHGLCVFLGIGKNDGESNADHLAQKIKNLRIFEDEHGKMNRSVEEIREEILVVSQFTLYGDCRKGNRPSFSDAAPPDEAEKLYEYFVQRLRGAGLIVATGQFKARMDVTLTNDGPVTFIVET